MRLQLSLFALADGTVACLPCVRGLLATEARLHANTGRLEGALVVKTTRVALLDLVALVLADLIEGHFFGEGRLSRGEKLTSNKQVVVLKSM